MPATLTTTIGKTARKNTLRLLLSILAIFLTATFFVACGKSDDEGGGGGGGSDENSEKSEKSGKGQADWKKGVSSMKDGEYEDAVEHFNASAEKGNTDAQIMLAICYAAGIGMDKKDYEENIE